MLSIRWFYFQFNTIVHIGLVSVCERWFSFWFQTDVHPKVQPADKAMGCDLETKQGLWIHSHSHSQNSKFQNARWGHHDKEHLTKCKWSMFVDPNYCNHPSKAELLKWHSRFSMPSQSFEADKDVSLEKPSAMEHWIVLFLD